MVRLNNLIIFCFSLLFSQNIFSAAVTLQTDCDPDGYSQDFELGTYGTKKLKIREYTKYSVEMEGSYKVKFYSGQSSGQSKVITANDVKEENCVTLPFEVASLKIYTGNTTKKISLSPSYEEPSHAAPLETEENFVENAIQYTTINNYKELQDSDYVTIYSKTAGGYCWNDTQNDLTSCTLKKPNIAAHYRVSRARGEKSFSLIGYDIFGSHVYNRYCGIKDDQTSLKCNSVGSLYKKLKSTGYRIGNSCNTKAKYIHFKPKNQSTALVIRPKQEELEFYCKRKCDEDSSCQAVQIEMSGLCNSNVLKSKRQANQYRCGCKIITLPHGDIQFDRKSFYRFNGSDSVLDSHLFLKLGVFLPDSPSVYDQFTLQKGTDSNTVTLKSKLTGKPLYFDENEAEVMVEKNPESLWIEYPYKNFGFSEEQGKNYKQDASLDAAAKVHQENLHLDINHCEAACAERGSCLGVFHTLDNQNHHTCILKKTLGKAVQANGSFFRKNFAFAQGFVANNPISVTLKKDDLYIHESGVLSHIDKKGCEMMCLKNKECNVFLSNGSYCALFRNGGPSQNSVYYPEVSVWGTVSDLKFYQKRSTSKPNLSEDKYQFVLKKIKGKDFSSKGDEMIKQAILNLKSKSRTKLEVNKKGSCKNIKDLYDYFKCLRFDPETQVTSPPSTTSSALNINLDDIRKDATTCIYKEKKSVSLADMSGDEVVLFSTDGLIYPGSIIAANINFLTGNPTPVVVRAQRAPYKVNIKGIPGIESSSIEVDPALGDEPSQITEGLNKAQNEYFASGATASIGIDMNVYEVTSVEQAATSIGITVESAYVDLDVKFGMESKKEGSTFIAKIKQKFFTLEYTPDVNLNNIYPSVKKSNPELWNDFIQTVGVGDGADPLAAITQVQYGSMFIATIKTSEKMDKMSLEASLKGGVEGVVKVGATASHSSEKSSSSMSVSIKGIGISGAAASKCLVATGNLALLKKCMADMVGFNKQNQGKPLAYKAKYLGGRNINSGGEYLAGRPVSAVQMSGGGLERECQATSPDQTKVCGRDLLIKTCPKTANWYEEKTRGKILRRYRHKTYANNPGWCQKRCEKFNGCTGWASVWDPKLDKKGGAGNEHGCWLMGSDTFTPKNNSKRGNQTKVGSCNTKITAGVPKETKETKRNADWKWVRDKKKDDYDSDQCTLCPASLYKNNHCRNGGGGTVIGEKACGFAKCRARCSPHRGKHKEIKW